MRLTLVRSFMCLLALGACGDDDGGTDGGNGADGGTGDGATLNCAANGGADCFELPTGVMTKGATTNAANFNCPAHTITTRAESMTATGRILDFQTDEPVPNATIKGFLSDNITGAFDVMATADGSGMFTITIPSGARSRMNWLTERPAGGGLPTYALNNPLDVTMAAVTGYDRQSISVLTANALPAFIGHSRTEGLGVVAGVFEDCDGDFVQHAIGTVASAASDGNANNIAFVPGAEVYYFVSGLPTRRNQRGDTNTDGIFVVIEIPPTAEAFLQVWGFTSEADVAMGKAGLTLISEYQTTVLGDSVIAFTVEPTEGPL